MSTFEALLKIGLWSVVALTAVFFGVFFYFCYIWSNMHDKKQRLEIATMVTFMYGFIFFGLGSMAAIALSTIGHFLYTLIGWLK